MQQVILDTNIVLDVFLIRKPFYNDAFKLFSIIKCNRINAFVTATSITDIYYVLRKSFGRKDTISYLKSLLDIVGIIDTNSNIILDALDSDWEDFEDAVQGYSALHNNIDYIITRNLQDFQHLESVKMVSAEEFVTNFH